MHLRAVNFSFDAAAVMENSVRMPAASLMGAELRQTAVIMATDPVRENMRADPRAVFYNFSQVTETYEVRFVVKILSGHKRVPYCNKRFVCKNVLNL